MSIPFNLYSGSLGKSAAYQYNFGMEANPIADVENNLLRVIFRKQDYIDPSYAPGGANYGHTPWPFDMSVAYRECALDAFCSALKNNTALPAWSEPVILIPNSFTPMVSVDTAGNIHITVSKANFTFFSDYILSLTGTPSVTHNVDFMNAAAHGYVAVASIGVTYNQDGSITTHMGKISSGDNGWTAASYHGSSLSTLSYVDASAWWPTWRTIEGTVYGVQQYDFAGFLGSEIAFLVGGYNSSKVIVGFNDLVGYSFGTQSQICDTMNVFEYDGATYLLFDVIENQLYDPTYMAVGFWNDTYDNVLRSYAGLNIITPTPTDSGILRYKTKAGKVIDIASRATSLMLSNGSVLQLGG